MGCARFKRLPYAQLTSVYIKQLNKLQNAIARHIEAIQSEGFVRTATCTDLPGLKPDKNMNKETFVKYLEETLIPDFKQAGLASCAVDFETALTFLKSETPSRNNNPIRDFMTRLGDFLAQHEVSATSDLNIQAIEGRMTIITATEADQTRILVWDNAKEGQEVASWQE